MSTRGITVNKAKSCQWGLLILLALTATTLSQASLPKSAQTRCNKVTLKYFRDSVKFHEYPTRDTWVRACDDEYANYKGCCDTESLRELMKKFVMSDALRWNNALVKVGVFEKEIVQNFEQLKTKIDGFLPGLKKAAETNKELVTISESAEYLSKYLPSMKNTTYNERMQAYKGQAQACFDTLTQVRKGSMCIICSSRAQQFFKNDIMNIKQSTCDSVLRDCYPNFQFMFTVMTTLQSLFEVANSGSGEPKFPIGFDPVPTKSLSTNAMMNGTNSSSLTVQVRTDFCETHLYLGKPNDHLEGFNDLLSKASGITEAIMKLPATPIWKNLAARPTSIYMKIKVDVLSDLEPNGEDLTKIDPRVGTKNRIMVENTGKFSFLVSGITSTVIAIVYSLTNL